MSLSIKFPMILGQFGFSSYADDQTKQAINQNLKMLLLTKPGEYVNDINFGVGLYTFLFEMANPDTEQQISQKIKQQVLRYMPYVVIKKIDFDQTSIDNGALGIGLHYTVNNDIKQEYLHLHVNI